MLRALFVALSIGAIGCASTTSQAPTDNTPTNVYGSFNLANEASTTSEPTPLPEVGASMRDAKEHAFKQYQENPTPENLNSYSAAVKAYNDYMRVHHQYIDTTNIDTSWDLQ